MGKYTCEICKKTITDSEEGLLVQIRDFDGHFIEGVSVHKGSCDERLIDNTRKKGLCAYSSQEISFFDNDEERKKYLNDEFKMNDEKLFGKYYNENGTLKHP